MPAYGSSGGSVFNLEGGRPTVVWDEVVAVGSASLAAGLQRNEHLPNCLSLELAFAANPGAFAVDLQVADTNEEKYYVTKSTFNSGLNTQFVGRIEATNVVAKFVRLKMVTLTNPVAVLARFF